MENDHIVCFCFNKLILFFQGLNNHFGTIKSQVGELHRDVSERRLEATSYHRVEEIVIECTQLTNELENTDQLMKDRKDLFHKMWEEEQQRIMSEQQIFKEQVGQEEFSIGKGFSVGKSRTIIGIALFQSSCCAKDP